MIFGEIMTFDRLVLSGVTLIGFDPFGFDLWPILSIFFKKYK